MREGEVMIGCQDTIQPALGVLLHWGRALTGVRFTPSATATIPGSAESRGR
jgi:hypothetical protein